MLKLQRTLSISSEISANVFSLMFIASPKFLAARTRAIVSRNTVVRSFRG
jgi:hypothetical protein